MVFCFLFVCFFAERQTEFKKSILSRDHGGAGGFFENCNHKIPVPEQSSQQVMHS